MAIVQGAMTHKTFKIPDHWTFGYNWGVQEISYSSDTLCIVFTHWNWESQNIHSFQSTYSRFLFVLDLIVSHCFISGDRRSRLGIIIFAIDEIWSSFVFLFWLALSIVELNKSSPHKRVFAGSVKTFKTCFVVRRGSNCLWKMVFHYRYLIEQFIYFMRIVKSLQNQWIAGSLQFSFGLDSVVFFFMYRLSPGKFYLPKRGVSTLIWAPTFNIYLLTSNLF